MAMSFFDYALSELLFLLILFHRIVTRIGGLQVQYQKLSSQEAAYWSSRELVEESMESLDSDWGTIQDFTFNKEIKFSNVSFKYPEANSAVVSKLNLVIPSKNLVVITGGSGWAKLRY